jgi:FkbM family methyltransferase
MDYFAQTTGYVARHFLPRGRRRLARFLMKRAPQRELTYRDQWGYRRKARLTDEMEACGFTGLYTLPPSVARRIASGSWVLDVGANVGLVTAQLCRLAGPGGQVWAVEPVPGNVARLEQLKKLNGLAQLTIIAGALSDRAGHASLRLPVGGASGHASFTRSWQVAGTIEVPTWPLDELVYRSPPARRLAFIKIDVEGFEPQVLAGAQRTLQEMKPLILCEFNDILLQDAGTSSAALLQQFAELGYQPIAPVPALTGIVVDLLLLPHP